MPTVGRRPPIVLLTILGVALAAGAAASLLAGSNTSSGVPAGPASELVVPARWFVYGLLGVFLAGVAYLVYLRATIQTVPVPGRIVVTILVVVLVATVFVLILHYAVAPNSTTVPGQGGGSSGTNGSHTNGTNLAGTGGGVVFPSLPPWASFAILAAVAVLAAALVVPFARSLLDERRHRAPAPLRPEKEKTELSSVLEHAGQALDEGGDPRSVILALYEAMLTRLARVVGSVDIETPEEIRRFHLVRLGIRPVTAEELTRLFEVARYSTHPLGPAEGQQASLVFREALRELTREPVAA